jgi:hypothetical protein
MGEDRSWIYSGCDKGEKYMDEWMDKATTFLDNAFSRTQIVRCPCSRHQNLKCLENKRTITIHLCKNGFVPSYEVWIFHGKSGTRVIVEDEYDCDMGNVDRIDKMLDAIQAYVTKYKEEVVKKYDEDFNYKELIDDRVVYDSGGGKAHGR